MSPSSDSLWEQFDSIFVRFSFFFLPVPPGRVLRGDRRCSPADTIDIVRDPISPGEYKPEEDPKLYHSSKTGRGPLGDDWLEAAAAGGPLMCAYKLCKVEFRYWGMQSKIEQFIHDVGLRKVMLRAHRQAWCWQDEWTDLTMEDIRQLEEETARMLAQKMAKCGEAEEPPTAGISPEGRPETGGPGGQEGAELQGGTDASSDDTFAKQWSTSSRSSYSSQHGGGVSPQSLSEWRMQNIARDSENSSEEEFFDAHEDLSDSDEVFAKEMTKWSSNDFLDTLERPAELDEAMGDGASAAKADSEGLGTSGFPEGGAAESAEQMCRIHALFLILHSGNILDQGAGEPGSKQADVQTLAATFDAVTRVHFPEALGHVALRLVPCPPICAAAYTLVSKYAFTMGEGENGELMEGPQPAESEESSIYSPAIPREKWQRKRTQVKIRNVTANHRACDVIVCEGKAQVLSGRFMYGPLDVVTLTGEKVDIYIMTQPLSGKWLYYGTEVTSGSGRLTFTIPPDKALAIGIYPVRMVVRGDHSYAEAYLTVVARGTESVVFSIDGSFTASVSIMGSDPKVRAGAVDVVRHWQDAGYMIIYVTGRPDMQKHRVVAWLSQHNFPHGAVSFCDGLTHDPLRQKAAFLQSLRTECLAMSLGHGELQGHFH
ncbi:membrane-associated phosphatidylinositol transfer protein 1 [Manacus vitellinus]|uniref:membrane-associated phosphatidylinositol transfer protein 1 n=1 Tax=Manacus vitellinus TaxID=328815 RepID=UPI00115EB33A|nr:membrane-associated phosphatidylinositol transfer protein 1 [Manacus vitellinus]